MKRGLTLVTKPAVEINHVATGKMAHELRKQCDLKLRELGRRMKLSPSYLCDLEKGNRKWTESMMTRFCANCYKGRAR